MVTWHCLHSIPSTKRHVPETVFIINLWENVFMEDVNSFCDKCLYRDCSYLDKAT